MREIAGQGMTGTVGGVRVAIGSASFVADMHGAPRGRRPTAPVVAAGDERGWVRLSAASAAGHRAGRRTRWRAPRLCLLSGDHGDASRRAGRACSARRMHFRQSPEDKLAFVRRSAGAAAAAC